MFKAKQTFSSFNDVESVCLFRLSAIGDILNLIPSLELLLQNYPQVQVTWIIGKSEYTLFKNLAVKYPQLKFEVFDKKNTSYCAAFKQLRALGEFDLLLHTQTSMRANLLVSFIRAKEKVGYSKERSFEGHSLVVHRNIAYQDSMHVMVDYFDLFKPFFTEKEQKEFKERIKDTALMYSNSYPESLAQQQNLHPLIELGFGEPGSEQALHNIQEQNRPFYHQLYTFSKYNVTREAQSKLIFVNPASSALKKNWTLQGYVSLITYLLSNNHKVVITGGNNPTELALVNGVAAQVMEYLQHQPTLANKAQEVFYNLAGKTTLAELYLFISLADLVVSPDSGPMHLASCLGIPTLGLFAYINPLRSGPIQGVADVISVYHQNTYGNDIKFTAEQYALDLKNWRKKPPKSDDKLMLQISADTVIKRVKEILNRLD